jgi:hypothetical protein
VGYFAETHEWSSRPRTFGLVDVAASNNDALASIFAMKELAILGHYHLRVTGSEIT